MNVFLARVGEWTSTWLGRVAATESHCPGQRWRLMLLCWMKVAMTEWRVSGECEVRFQDDWDALMPQSHIFWVNDEGRRCCVGWRLLRWS